MAFFCMVNLFSTHVLAQTSDHYCGDDDYESNSIFEQNLNNILYGISSSMGDSGYYSNSTGTDPDTVHVAALCRADTQLEDCQSCVSQVAQDIQQNCNSINAYGWNSWCILRVSNSTTYWDEYDSSSDNSTCLSTDPSRANPEIPDSAQGNVDTLLHNLSFNASSQGSSDLRVAANDFPGEPVIYALVQCMPDLNGDDCDTCLNSIVQRRSSCDDNNLGTVVLTPRCFLQYETYPFYNSTRLQQVEDMYITSSSPPSTETPSPPPTETPVPQGSRIPGSRISPPPRSSSPASKINWKITIAITAALVFSDRHLG